MDLGDGGGKDHQQDGVMRLEHPGGEQDDRHVRAEPEGATNEEADEMRDEHEGDRPEGHV